MDLVAQTDSGKRKSGTWTFSAWDRNLSSLSRPGWLMQFGDLLLHAFTTQGLKHSQLRMGAKLILFTPTPQDYAGLMLDLLFKLFHVLF